MRVYQTKWPELQFAHITGYNVTLKRNESFWQFLNENRQVGLHYPTRETLIADMARYAKESWNLV